MMYVEARQRLVDWLERQLVGPAWDVEGSGGDQERGDARRPGAGKRGARWPPEPDARSGGADSGGSEQEDRDSRVSPLGRYPVGVLHPLESEAAGVDPASEDTLDMDDREAALSIEDEAVAEEDEDSPSDEESDDRRRAKPVRRRRYVPPASVGLSFCVHGDDVRLRIEAAAAVYDVLDRGEEGRFVEPRYRRNVLREVVCFGAPDDRKKNRRIRSILDERAGIDVQVRSHREGRIFTVTLANLRRAKPGGNPRQRVQDSLFEAVLECVVERGTLVDYPRLDPSLLTDEERELELQYRERRIFAVGHGAAVDWDVPPGRSPRLWTDFLPKVETPIVSVAARGGADVLEFECLEAEDLPLRRLRAFVGEYGAWVGERMAEAGEFENSRDRETARRICVRMEEAHERMLRGIELLGGEPHAALAFRLANRAMRRQMARFRQADDQAPFAWRPFQLGFLLATIESTILEEDDHRSTLELIWFQTGGGKTEAYLGLIAFLLLWRRLTYGEQGGGTAAFMRYTLRLLTRQQFERAARLFCALELLRREEGAERLGAEPFTVGVWVGRGVCPNRLDEAREILDKVRAGDDEERKRLLLLRCPWCKEQLDPSRGYHLSDSDRDFRFFCVNTDCDFGPDGDAVATGGVGTGRHGPLPCRVVDDSLYEHPPSLLIATIDKFARLAWEERASAFFGAAGVNRSNRRAPDLVIQDELHLIAGPLGSVAGLYEAGIETAIRCRGVRPKYVASTATIRMAREQVRSLYGRGVAVFPPPGLSSDDSWFARVDRARPGRLYIGYLAPSLDEQHCLAPVAAALMAGPLVVFREEPDASDLFEAWWTSVVYHGSLRGVATSSNAFASDVRDRGGRLIEEYLEERERDGSDGASVDSASEEEKNQAVEFEKALRRRFDDSQVEQLWSRHTAEQLADTFERLGLPRGKDRCLDAVLSTNMVSVGLDVARLAVMVVNGQPLTTAEYVQATSRVGRGDVPGIVVANYYRHQARSLSHYESFRPYHDSFYRFVEPGSLTPFTYQVRRRALHAALVIALRHACGDLRSNQAAGEFELRNPTVSTVVDEFRRRLAEACAEQEEVAGHLDRLLHEWQREAERCREARMSLRYDSRNDKAYACLLRAPENGQGPPSRGLWETLNSMRNVEASGVLRVMT